MNITPVIPQEISWPRAVSELVRGSDRRNHGRSAPMDWSLDGAAGSAPRHDGREAALRRSVDVRQILTVMRHTRWIRRESNSVIFHQGDLADSIYFVETGRIKLSRVCSNGREIILSVLMDGDFVGESCLIRPGARLTTAVCLVDSRLLRIERDTVVSLLRTSQTFAEDFMAYLLTRNSRNEDELENQLCHSAERRLARTLLLLAQFARRPEPLKRIPYINHETLAQIVGTTRARISYFMHLFRNRGFIDYNRREIVVRASLLDLLLDERTGAPPASNGNSKAA